MFTVPSPLRDFYLVQTGDFFTWKKSWHRNWGFLYQSSGLLLCLRRHQRQPRGAKSPKRHSALNLQLIKAVKDLMWLYFQNAALDQSWYLSRPMWNSFPGNVMFSEKKSNIIYFLSNLSTFCIISYTNGVNLGTYCEKLHTYCVRFRKNVVINRKVWKQKFSLV